MEGLSGFRKDSESERDLGFWRRRRLRVEGCFLGPLGGRGREGGFMPREIDLRAGREIVVVDTGLFLISIAGFGFSGSFFLSIAFVGLVVVVFVAEDLGFEIFVVVEVVAFGAAVAAARRTSSDILLFLRGGTGGLDVDID